MITIYFYNRVLSYSYFYIQNKIILSTELIPKNRLKTIFTIALLYVIEVDKTTVIKKWTIW